ncbi:MAG TPA: thiolase family protein [Syntrophomonadaceae bacterium]|nr:thiolase family protein [Syntrophomonadaceae bacterium]
MNEVVMVSACRTPVGKFMGQFKDVSARELAVTVGKEAIKRAGIAADTVDEIVMGQVYQHMQKSLPARIVGLECGLPVSSNACVVNQNCTSSMRALEIACHNIMLGNTEIGLVIGVENMTQVPYMVPSARTGARMGNTEIVDALTHDALIDSLVPGHMGRTAENIAEMYNITREQCDELAMISHNRAIAAIDSGVFKKEIIPIEVKTRAGAVIVEDDEHPIRDVSIEKMGKLKPVFKRDGGVVTAANASGINDGAAAVILMSKKKAEELNIKPLMKYVTSVGVGVEPEIMGVGPAEAIPAALNKAGWKWDEVEYWEINEAFAAQFLGVKIRLQEKYGIDLSLDKVNHNGSGISLGHPVGCTGLRIIVSLYYEMERLNISTGGASLCVGTGPAMASLWTRDI